jgi:thiol-disulfide isomerase/thioredoxin
MKSELHLAGECGFAAAQCGEAPPFRRDHFDEGEAAPRLGGVASLLQSGPGAGKAKPYRTVLRQSRKSILLGMVLVLLVSLSNYSSNALSGSLHSQEGFEMPVQERARVRAPELQGDRGWLNTDKPLSLAALKGKVVLLDFWTYGCINCMHIIPDLKRLEKKYPNELVVIGVHSAKFENEKDTENIRRIVLRYEIEHPIVNDADFAIWRSYAVNAWPTRYLIDPGGYIIGKLSGEGSYEALDKAIADTIAEFR